MTTIQKIAPLWVISTLNVMKILILISILSAVVSSILIFNVFSTKILLAYSRISHLSWILIIIPFNISLC
ncbi:hypothetical protein JQN64_24655 [Escherichia coli]|nr:hypothetical protein [Escherichia coli]